MKIQKYRWKGYKSWEILQLVLEKDLIRVESQIEGFLGQQEFMITYSLVLSKVWEIKEVKLSSSLSTAPPLHLKHFNGHWYDNADSELPNLRECRDIDISVTPFTNSLPIKRLGDKLDKPQPLKVVYLNGLIYGTERVTQEYHRTNGNIYSFRNLNSGFSSKIYVDQDGLVTEYPGFFYKSLEEDKIDNSKRLQNELFKNYWREKSFFFADYNDDPAND